MKPIEFSKDFQKDYKKRICHDRKLVKKFGERYELFASGKRDAPLFDHALQGDMSGLRSFSITGDIRVVYKEYDDVIIFDAICTHTQVYGL